LHSRVEALIRVSSTPLGSFELICSSNLDSSGNNTCKYHYSDLKPGWWS